MPVENSYPLFLKENLSFVSQNKICIKIVDMGFLGTTKEVKAV